jgi:hypothetical protein
MSDWTPVHHVMADEPPADPDGPPAKGPTVAQREGKPKSEEKGTPVGLTLNLPPDFISAVWGFADAVTRMAIAVEENTKAVLKSIEGKKNVQPRPVRNEPDPSA